MRLIFAAAACAVSFLSVSPSAAATVLLTGASTASGNSLLYTAGGVKFSVTGLTYGGVSFSFNTTPTNSKPGKYTEGLGIKPTGDDRHTVDNSKGWDFLLFRFDTKVALNGATFANANWYGDATADTDATISTANFAFSPALTYASNLTGTAKTTFHNGVRTQFAAKAFSSNTTKNGTSPRSFNNGAFNAFSNVWVVGASTVNRDGNIDSFKLTSISYDVGAPVPEPATWMMLILGFGMIGAVMRGRKTRVAFA